MEFSSLRKTAPLLCILIALDARAETLQECMALAVQSAAPSTTVGELQTYCEQTLQLQQETQRQETQREEAQNQKAQNNEQQPQALTEQSVTPASVIERQVVSEASGADGAMAQRLALERYSRNNPFVLTPHRVNYVLPLVYLKDPNEKVFADRTDEDFELQNLEFQFQLSLKATVWDNVLGDNSHLSFAYTNRSFWQAYNNDISAAFRETNHEPEVLLTFENDWEIFGFRNVANQVIANHHSNGRAGSESRSWNRLMLNAIFERDNLVMSIKPWYRLPEESSDDPDDFNDDDNPDIDYYMGHFEWFATWQQEENVYSVLLRNNLRSDNRGAIELGWSFPIGGRFKGYIKYFNGYGDSLIDYNDSSESLGIGVLISDWL